MTAAVAALAAVSGRVVAAVVVGVAEVVAAGPAVVRKRV